MVDLLPFALDSVLIVLGTLITPQWRTFTGFGAGAKSETVNPNRGCVTALTAVGGGSTINEVS